MGDDAERRLEALQRVLRVGRRRRDLRNARVVIDLRGRDRGARVQVADHAVDLRVDQLRGGGGALLRVGRVVLGQQLELDRLATELDALGVQVLDRELGAQFVVLAQVGDAAGQRAHVADLDDRLRRGDARGEGERRGDCEAQDLLVQMHGCLSWRVGLVSYAGRCLRRNPRRRAGHES